MSSKEVHPDVAGYTEFVRADERARCIKVLEDLRDDNRSQVGKQWLATAIAALSEAPTPPVASSPVGGEQHGE